MTPKSPHLNEKMKFSQGEDLHRTPRLTSLVELGWPKTPKETINKGKSVFLPDIEMKAEGDRCKPQQSLLRQVPWSFTPRSSQWNLPKLDGEKIPSSAAVSNSWPETCSCCELKSILTLHHAEVMGKLQQLLSQHDQHLDHSLSNFQECLQSLQLSGLSKQVSSKSVGYSATLKDPRSPSAVSTGTAGTRRTSVSSVPSCGSDASAYGKYVSVQELRNQCLSKTNSSMGRSRTRFLGDDHGSVMVSRVRSIVNNFFFELFFAALIIVNSIMLGVEVAVVSSDPTKPVPHFFYYSTMFFTSAFFTELSIRLLGEGGLVAFLCYSELRAWNWFDLLVVLCSLVEVGFQVVLLGGGSQSVTRIMRMARMTRLGRVLRVARIVRFVSQLRVLVISIMSTLQTLLWALFLLILIIYVFAVLIAQATAEHFSEDPSYDKNGLVWKEDRLGHYWGSLHAAMYTLFMSIAGGVSWEAAVFPLAEVHWIWGGFFTCFIAFSSFALINVMTAVFCQSAIETAQRNMDVKWQTMCNDKQKHINTLKGLFNSIQGNEKGTISVRKLEKCWSDEAMQSFLNSMELQPDDCWTFFTVLDKQNKEVSAAEFVEGCLRLKGNAKAFDMAVMTYELRHMSKQNVMFMNRMQACVHAILYEMRGSSGHVSDESNGSDYASGG